MKRFSYATYRFLIFFLFFFKSISIYSLLYILQATFFAFHMDARTRLFLLLNVKLFYRSIEGGAEKIEAKHFFYAFSRSRNFSARR